MYATIFTVRKSFSLLSAEWSSWSAWEPCTVTCGGGTETSSRKCLHESEEAPTEECVPDAHVDVREQSCSTEDCPIPSRFTEIAKKMYAYTRFPS